jgi:hypothetical protein
MALEDPSDTAMGAATGAATLGIGAATGNPIAMIQGIAALGGIGMSLFGTSKEAQAKKEEAELSTKEAQLEMQINEQRKQLATDIYNRQTTENFRTAQLAAHRSRATAVGQGAQYSSGARAGEEQQAAGAAWNQLGLMQNYQIGQNIFGMTSDIDQLKVQMAQLGTQAATGAGYAAIGSGLMQGSSALGRIGGFLPGGGGQGGGGTQP